MERSLLQPRDTLRTNRHLARNQMIELLARAGSREEEVNLALSKQFNTYVRHGIPHKQEEVVVVDE